MLHGLCGLEYPGDRVVIVDANRVKFMIMTSSAPHRQSHERATDGFHLLIDDVHFHLCLIHFRKDLRPKRQKPCGNGAINFDLLISGIGQKISGQLIRDKLAIGQIFVPRPNHPIPISPRISMSDILVHPVGIGIPSDSQPIPPPPLSVGW